MVFGFMACHTSLPSSFRNEDSFPPVYPDYINVCIPPNIAPLSMEFLSNADKVLTRYSCAEMEIVCKGTKAVPGLSAWRKLTAKARGKAIEVEVFTRQKDEWIRFKPFHIQVSTDSINPYITYRLIAPSFVTYEELSLNQRCLENYQERTIYNNMLCGTENQGQCINCHHSQNHNPERIQFHARQRHGGTLLAYDGKLRKVNMTNDSILSAGVYPAWHPYLNLIVYSTNKTMQSFHTRHINKIEVLDAQSDLIVFDVERNEVMNIEADTCEFEVYPAWSPDGKWLYFSSAHFEYETNSHQKEAISRAKEIRYNLYRKAFDPETRSFGPKELVYDAAAQQKSATLPRVSPDGNYLLFSMGNYGCFHIWHHEADLYLLDLASLEARVLSEVNSDAAESFHNWSGNGRWILFSSRRNDGNYTRLFFAHIDENGQASKAFELPSKDPDYHRQLMKSYNIPEFLNGPVRYKPQDFAKILKNDEVSPVVYVKSLQKE